MTKSKKFPKVVYVSRENEGEEQDEYLNLCEDIEAAAPEKGETSFVAVYELKEVVSVSTKVEVEGRK